MSSTVERSLASKKEIEDGSVVVDSTPTVGTFVAVIPFSIEVSRALAVERCTGPMLSGWLRTTITPSSAPNSPLAWVKSPPPHQFGQGAADHDLPPDPGAQFDHLLRFGRQFGEARVGEFFGQAGGVDRLAHHPDADQLRPGRPERFFDRRGDFARQVAEGDQGDLLALQPVAGQHRVDLFVEFFGLAEFAAQVFDPRAGVLEVADQAVLEVLARFRQRVAAELGADQDPYREGEEDCDQRGCVIARAVAHLACKG